MKLLLCLCFGTSLASTSSGLVPRPAFASTLAAAVPKLTADVLGIDGRKAACGDMACTIAGDDIRWNVALLRLRRRRAMIEKAMIAAMPISPRTIPIPAATPRDKADAVVLSGLLVADAVADGVKAKVAVKTTVTDPGRTLEVGNSVVLVVDVVDLVVDFVVDLEVVDVVLVDVDPSGVVPKRLPGYTIASPSCTEGVV